MTWHWISLTSKTISSAFSSVLMVRTMTSKLSNRSMTGSEKLVSLGRICADVSSDWNNSS